jgi:hypothetical protein
MSVSIDDILGPNVDNIASTNITDMSNKYNNTILNFSKNKTDNNIGIDSILNNGLINFENKQQTSMFFITYKSLDTIYKELKSKYNFTIPNELVEKAINIIIPDIIKEYTGNMKKRSKKVICNDMICMGRKLDNKQCSRKKHNGSDFCKSHLTKLSNGRIDEPTKPVNRNKRGRKRKVQFDPRQYDNEYITLWEDIVDGHKVLVDNNNNVYTFNLDNPLFLGKKDINLKLDLDKINKSTSNTKVSIENNIPHLNTQSIIQSQIIEPQIIKHKQVEKDLLTDISVKHDFYSSEEIISKLDIDIGDKIKELTIIEETNISENKIEIPITKSTTKHIKIIKKKATNNN